MGHVIEAILGLDGTAVYVVIGLLAFGEAAAFVGLLLPGEVAVLLGGALAAQGRVSLPVMVIVAAVAAVAGDSAGYELGRRWGSRLLATKMGRRHAHLVRDVMGHLQRHGGAVVFLGRWTSLLRAVVPAMAGMSRMPYGRFAVFNVIGGVAWAAVFTFAGYAAGASYRSVEAATGRGGWIVAAVVVGWASIRLVLDRRRRHARRRDGGDEPCCATGPGAVGDVGTANETGAAPVESRPRDRSSPMLGSVVAAAWS